VLQTLEWCAYRIVKKFDGALIHFDRIPACGRQMRTGGQTNRQTDILRQRSPRYAWHRAVKNYKDTATVTVEDEWKLGCGLANGAIFNDLERPSVT